MRGQLIDELPWLTNNRARLNRPALRQARGCSPTGRPPNGSFQQTLPVFPTRAHMASSSGLDKKPSRSPGIGMSFNLRSTECYGREERTVVQNLLRDLSACKHGPVKEAREQPAFVDFLARNGITPDPEPVKPINSDHPSGFPLSQLPSQSLLGNDSGKPTAKQERSRTPTGKNWLRTQQSAEKTQKTETKPIGINESVNKYVARPRHGRSRLIDTSEVLDMDGLRSELGHSLLEASEPRGVSSARTKYSLLVDSPRAATLPFPGRPKVELTPPLSLPTRAPVGDLQGEMNPRFAEPVTLRVTALNFPTSNDACLTRNRSRKKTSHGISVAYRNDEISFDGRKRTTAQSKNLAEKIKTFLVSLEFLRKSSGLQEL